MQTPSVLFGVLSQALVFLNHTSCASHQCVRVRVCVNVSNRMSLLELALFMSP